ncbi:MAG: 5-formyltetrahydrofolate cyclo-ligase [Acidimicrobiales bacterium]|nr:5-formyltetrahydrofolate cyclo-ligase [Acidimicrobiales bacterium]
MTDIGDRKAAARKQGFEQRALAHAQGGDAAANLLLLEHVLSFEPVVVSAYMPMRTEIDPLVAMAELHARGVRICVPIIEGKDLPLSFREWTPTVELEVGPFGAAVPVTGETLEPEVVVTPLVAFDRRGYRLGYGGGFYDRTFERLHAAGGGVGIGFAYSGQEIDEVPTEATDIRLHSIVTESAVLLVDV